MCPPGADSSGGHRAESERPQTGEGSLSRAISQALTGDEAALDLGAGASAASIERALTRAGWTRQSLALHVRTVREQGGRWPHAVPSELLRTAGPARVSALLADARSVLGQAGVEAMPRPRPGRLSADDVRLLREVPPHHGT